MARVRFAPSPTGSLHLGGALSAVANRRFADERTGSFLLRIDDTDPARNVEGGADAIVSDLEWLGVPWDEGPLRQSERHVRHREAALIRALGAEPPEYIPHGLLLGEDGTKLSKRHGASSLADLRDEGIPPEAVRAYLEELGLPRHDVHLDLARVRRLSTETLAGLSDDELAARVGVPVLVAPVLRGARDLAEARE